MKTKTVAADLSGASSAEVFVNESLEAEASGASSLAYKGNVKNIDIDKSGAASVHQKK